MIRIIKIIHFEQLRISFVCDKYTFTYFEYGYNAFMKKVFKYTLKFIEIYVCDFKKVFNHNQICCLPYNQN